MTLRKSNITLSIIFSLISLLHLLWALGLTYGLNETLPTTSTNELVLAPKTIDCISVSILLFLFAAMYVKTFKKRQKLQKFFLWFIPILFSIRAIGEFKYVGFFKSVTNTLFAHYDSLLYSPLCVLIALLGFYSLIKKEPKNN